MAAPGHPFPCTSSPIPCSTVIPKRGQVPGLSCDLPTHWTKQPMLHTPSSQVTRLMHCALQQLFLGVGRYHASFSAPPLQWCTVFLPVPPPSDPKTPAPVPAPPPTGFPKPWQPVPGAVPHTPPPEVSKAKRQRPTTPPPLSSLRGASSVTKHLPFLRNSPLPSPTSVSLATGHPGPDS